MTYEQYQNDLKTKSAVEWQLQIVAEAAYRLGNEAIYAPAQIGRT